MFHACKGNNVYPHLFDFIKPSDLVCICTSIPAALLNQTYVKKHWIIFHKLQLLKISTYNTHVFFILQHMPESHIAFCLTEMFFTCQQLAVRKALDGGLKAQNYSLKMPSDRMGRATQSSFLKSIKVTELLPLRHVMSPCCQNCNVGIRPDSSPQAQIVKKSL